MSLRTKLSAKLMQLSPYAIAGADSPIFRLEARRVNFGDSPGRLKINSVRLVTRLVTITWGIGMLISALPFMTQRQNYAYKMGNVLPVGIMLLGSWLLGLWLDYMSLSVSLGSIRSEVLNKRWELLSLTAMGLNRILISKHAAAQLRVWQATTIVTSVRLAVVLLVTAHGILAVINTAVVTRKQNFPLDLIVGLIGVSLSAIAIGTVYVLEPIWRARLTTAMGISISAYAGNLAAMFPEFLFGLGKIWGIAFPSAMGMGLAFPTILAFMPYIMGDTNALFFIVFVATFIIGLPTFWGLRLYERLQWSFLFSAQKRLTSQ